VGAITRWIDDRVDLASMRRTLLDRKMPAGLTWWHTLGSATLAVFTVQVVTGIVLAMYYSPSPDHAFDSIRYLERSVVSGATLRGIHHWGASAMVLLVVAHAVRVFTMGSYKYPREANWLLGVVLLVLVMAFGFTGYLLPWDQKAYWATQVGTNIAGTTPVVGGTLVRLLRGGGQLGAATLARFFALHVLVLPALLGGIVLLHLAIVVRQGIAPRPALLDENAPVRTDDPSYSKFYGERYAESKAHGVPFWPDIIVKDVVVATVVIVLLVILGRFVGAGLESPADPNDAAYTPRPEWYFLPFFQLLKLVPGSLESFVAAGLPLMMVLVLLLLPFFDRRSIRSLKRRPFSLAALGGTTAVCALLFGAAANESPHGVLAELGRPLTSAERAGRTLFAQQQCGSCHKVAGEKAEKKADAPDAPELTEVGLKHTPAWMHSFIEDPTRFHSDSKMPAFGPPTLSHQEIEELSQFLASLRGPNGATKQPEFRDTFPEPVKSKEKP
jgi:quinol-cytochrome oxidoreductase complex cytochrome b subunit